MWCVSPGLGLVQCPPGFGSGLLEDGVEELMRREQVFREVYGTET